MSTSLPTYVHGYGPAEADRLSGQAVTLEALLHRGTAYPPGSRVLEAGCGVGAQTLALLRNSPGIRLTCLDLAAPSLAAAAARVREAGLAAPEFVRGDVAALPFPDASFDHAFVCFVLEHLHDPGAALAELARVLRPGGSVTVIEGDHGSTLLHPDDPDARAAVACLVALQRRAGGDAEIGRRLYPLLRDAGFLEVQVAPRMVYVDGGHPALAEGFVRQIFVRMVAGVRGAAVAAGMATEAGFDAGLRALLRGGEPDGSFGYTFFKAEARRP